MRSNFALGALDVATWRGKDADLSRLVRHETVQPAHASVWLREGRR